MLVVIGVEPVIVEAMTLAVIDLQAFTFVAVEVDVGATEPAPQPPPSKTSKVETATKDERRFLCERLNILFVNIVL